MENTVKKFVVADDFLRSLNEAGLLQPDYSHIRRVVFDFHVGKPALMYTEAFADKDILDVLLTHGGVRITEDEDEAKVRG